MIDLSSISLVTLLASILVASTPILLAATGELVAEKSGVLNLGVEGMMIIGAICGFIAAVKTGSPLLGILFGTIAGSLLSLVFALITQYLLANQVASGLALTLFGLGLAALLGTDFTGIRPPTMPTMQIPVLSDLPILGELLFVHDPILYIGLALPAALWWFFRSTRAGLVVRAVGENHDAAHSIGYNVRLIRIAAIMFGGACAGMGGAYLSLVRVPQWTEGMTAGAGWIALAIVVFASWKPGRILLGAWLFGGLTLLQLNLQAAGIGIGVEYLSMSPYLATILVLVLLSADRNRRQLNAPACLGRGFHPEL